MHRKSRCTFPPSRLDLSRTSICMRKSTLVSSSSPMPPPSRPTLPNCNRRENAAAGGQRTTQPHEKHTGRAERLCVEYHFARPITRYVPHREIYVHQRLGYTCNSTPHPSPSIKITLVTSPSFVTRCDFYFPNPCKERESKCDDGKADNAVSVNGLSSVPRLTLRQRPLLLQRLSP
ncbi:hypothetical protein B0H13DRAFT_2564421 [Mycena leptocephala]|nr:hypothetical protein B0H13DRAFT_2564421 [Mycena leptocephala]